MRSARSRPCECRTPKVEGCASPRRGDWVTSDATGAPRLSQSPETFILRSGTSSTVTGTTLHQPWPPSINSNAATAIDRSAEKRSSLFVLIHPFSVTSAKSTLNLDCAPLF